MLTFLARRLVLTIPVLLTCACFVGLDTFHFYLVSIPAAGLSVLWLAHQFRLFRGEDASFLKNFRFLAPATPGSSTQ